MRKLILVTAIILASTAAHAGATRGLIALASSETAETKPADQAKPVEQAPAAQPADVKSAETKPVDAPDPRVDQKPRRKVRHESDRDWTERRIRSELARYGIY